MFRSEKSAVQYTVCEDAVSRVAARMPDEEPIYEVSELFRVFGDSTRSRILCALSIEDMCVGDLSAVLNMTQSAISHQLRLLKAARLVRCRKQGRVVYYALNDIHVVKIFQMAFDHIMEEYEG